jgi:hypothetical protein
MFTHLKTVNTYVYNPRNPWITYGVAIISTLFAIGIGLVAQTSNSSSYGRGFLSFLYATRNSDLDNLILASRDSRKPWNADASKEKLEKTKLRFRHIDGERKWLSTGGGHEAFALDET